MIGKFSFGFLILFLVAGSACAQWTQVFGPAGGSVRALASDTGHIYAGTDSGVFVSVNKGETWTQERIGLAVTRVFALSVMPDGTVLAGTDGGGIFRSTNVGALWSSANTGIPSGAVIYSIACDGHGNIYAGDSAHGVFYSSDDGQNWEPRNAGIENNAVYSLAIVPNGTVYAGSNAFIFSSNNYAQRWDRSDTVGPPSEAVLALGADSIGDVYAGTLLKERLLRTIADSQWRLITPSAVSPGERVNAIAAAGGQVFIGMLGAGVAQTSDLGSHWGNWSEGLSDPDVYALAAAPSDYLFAGTAHGGIFRVNPQLAVRTSVVSDRNLALWPEPFAGYTDISFSLQRAGLVQLSVFDALGREVRKIANQPMASGLHTLSYDASMLSIGVYRVVLETPDGVQSAQAVRIQ